jgi:hypothetical protein
VILARISQQLPPGSSTGSSSTCKGVIIIIMIMIVIMIIIIPIIIILILLDIMTTSTTTTISPAEPGLTPIFTDPAQRRAIQKAPTGPMHLEMRLVCHTPVLVSATHTHTADVQPNTPPQNKSLSFKVSYESALCFSLSLLDHSVKQDDQEKTPPFPHLSSTTSGTRAVSGGSSARSGGSPTRTMK